MELIFFFAREKIKQTNNKKVNIMKLFKKSKNSSFTKINCIRVTE